MHDCSHSLLTLSFCKLKAMPKNCTKFDKHLERHHFVYVYAQIKTLNNYTVMQSYEIVVQPIHALH